VKTELICLPCFHRQIERTLGYAGVNGSAGSRIRRQTGLILEEASLDQAPARISTLIHRMIRRETCLDPYKQVKDAYTLIALGKLPALRKMAAESRSLYTGVPDILEGSMRAAVAGNVIDFGIYEQFDLDRSVEESFRLPLSHADYPAFAAAVEKSTTILYLCDNAGEIVFDRVLLETLQDRGKKVTAVVKGAPVINDATMDDANAAGLADSATRVIDNGNDGIGTLLELCSHEFMDAYRTADMIISKGQANYETLAGERDNRTFFLFKVKCPVVAQSLKRENGDIVLIASS
jgi:uncharacterized protein with ATP-grasp and redox domains